MALWFLIFGLCYAVAIGGTALVLHAVPKLVGEHEVTLAELEDIAPELFDQSKNDSLSSL